MKSLQQIIKAFLDGFLPALFLVTVLACTWYFYQQKKDELPIIEELTDKYKIGWKTAMAFSTHIATHLVKLQRVEQQQLTNGETTGLAGDVNIPIVWKRSEIEEKLRAQGWSKGKMRAASAYLDYIDQYLDAAVNDMYQTGVSASITLAQGILESDAGRSHLATKTNNHFGIKARPTSSGRRKIKAKQYRRIVDSDFTYRSPAIGVSQHHDDHKYDRFEVYPTVLDSYRRHSQLLQNNCQKARKGCYGWIWSTYPVQQADVNLYDMAKRFEGVSGYAPDDFFGTTQLPYYAAQAAGLKMAGYATSKTYHRKLVYIIETYELWQLDLAMLRFLKQ